MQLDTYCFYIRRIIWLATNLGIKLHFDQKEPIKNIRKLNFLTKFWFFAVSFSWLRDKWAHWRFSWDKIQSLLHVSLYNQSCISHSQTSDMESFPPSREWVDSTDDIHLTRLLLLDGLSTPTLIPRQLLSAEQRHRLITWLRRQKDDFTLSKAPICCTSVYIMTLLGHSWKKLFYILGYKFICFPAQSYTRRAIRLSHMSAK